MRSLALLLTALSASAAPPELTSLFPAGVREGTPTEVTVSGKFEPWPPHVWVSDPAVTFTPDNDTKGKFTVTAATDLPAVLVRLYNHEGASAPKVFAISPHPTTTEIEPNSALTSPQLIAPGSLPLTIEGRLDPGGDVDLFAIPLESGTTLNARVLAYALGSPVDPLLHIRDAFGTRISFNHDATGTTLDPSLTFTAPTTSTYTVQLAAFAHPPQANIRFAGSTTSVYRLTLTLTPPTPPPAPDEPGTLEFPSAVTGTIDTPGQIDAYTFTSKKDTYYQFDVTASSLGYPTDPVLRILDADGKLIKTADDIDTKSNLDISLDWKCPADGSYTAEVTDRFTAGSPLHAYQFVATTPPPSFEVTAPAHAWTITPGEPLEIKLSLKRRHGHTADITVTAKNLPPGLTAEPVSAFDKKGAATLKITSTHETQPCSAPIGLIASNNPVTHSIIPATTDPGDLLITHTSDLWITITSKKVLVKDSQ